jgi:hypothetical protein
METKNFLTNQIKNKNFLSPIGFKFSLARAPKVDFFSNVANIPSLDLGNAVLPTYLRDLPIPGDKIIFGDFNLKFIVDEDFENYTEVHNWIRSLGYPRDLAEYSKLIEDRKKTGTNTNSELANIFSDGTLFILNSNFNSNIEVRFRDLYPYSLSTFEFNSTSSDYDYFTTEVSFKYTMFDLYNSSNKLIS